MKDYVNKCGKAILRRIQSLFKKNLNRFLRKASGVIHVGANEGQEIQLYARYRLPVIWIEPIPEVLEKLKSNLVGFPKQIALEGLVTDTDNAEYNFHLASNSGASSSILELNQHMDIWPEVIYEKTIKLFSRTLPTLLKDNDIDANNYDMLVIDTQGSELLVLKGSVPILQNFTYIKTEAPDFESYKGCCQIKDIDSFLSRHGFREISRKKFATHPNSGSYYDVIYKK